MKVQLLILTIASCLLLDPVFAGSARGAECANINPKEKDKEVLAEIDANCQSNYCYPGPSAANAAKTEWYCIDRKKNCSWPGEKGYMYGADKRLDGTSYECKNPGGGTRARFLPR